MITGARTPLPLDLTGLRVAITAGAGGIGRVMADSFAACGAELFVSDVDEAALVACPHPKMRADAGQASEMEGFVDAAVAALGGLDVLLNNAGIAGPTAPVEDVTPAELDAVLQVDYLYEEGANGPFTPVVRDVELRRVTSRRSNYALYLRGYEKAVIDDIRVVDCDFQGVAKPDVIEHVTHLQRRGTKVNGAVVTP